MVWLLLCFFSFQQAFAVRVKDLADIYGDRTNLVFGYGLVTGLKRTGDSNRNLATIKAMTKRLQGLGITLTPMELRSRNVASVMVTAEIPSGARAGQKIDILVSSSGDAVSLQGGVLQITPLQASDGQTYAIAQGPIVLGGFSASQSGSSTQKNHTTTGRIPVGAVIETENPNRLNLQKLEQIDYLLREPDFTTAQRMSDAINAALNQDIAIAVDSTAIAVQVPQEYQGNIVPLLAQIEVVDVQVDRPAKVVINERTGTVVMGASVSIETVAIAHGGLTIEVKSQNTTSQPNAVAQGDTVQNQNSQVNATEQSDSLQLVSGATIGDLVTALNKLGVKPRDLVQILVAIREAGALHAELEIL